MVAPAAAQESQLTQIQEQLTRLESRLAPVLEIAEHAPHALAALTDAIDARAEGAQLEERLSAAVMLLERLSRPEMVQSVLRLSEQLPVLEDAVDAVPKVVASATDLIDEAAADAGIEGLDMKRAIGGGIRIAAQVARTLAGPQLDLVERSPFFGGQALEVLDDASQAVVYAQEQPRQTLGPWGLYRALKDPDLQRALGFAVRIGQRFGGLLKPDAAS